MKAILQFIYRSVGALYAMSESPKSFENLNIFINVCVDLNKNIDLKWQNCRKTCLSKHSKYLMDFLLRK